MFDALWTLRLRWRFATLTACVIFAGLGAGLWSRATPAVWEARALVLIPEPREILLWRLNSAALATAAGVRPGTVRAQWAEGSQAVAEVKGHGATKDLALIGVPAILTTLQRQLATEAQDQMAARADQATATRRRVQTALAETEQQLRAEGVPVDGRGKAWPLIPPEVVIVGMAPQPVFRAALESRYLELTKALTALETPLRADPPWLTVLDPATTAHRATSPWGTWLRVLVVTALVGGALVTWVAEWWRRELAQRKGGRNV